MLKNNQTTALEYGKKSSEQLYLDKMTHDLLEYKIVGIKKGLIIPDDLIAELEHYVKRNPLKELSKCKKNAPSYDCCPRCLKAHMLKIAEDAGIDNKGCEFLALFMPGEVGHNGYYLDGDELIKI